MHVEEARERAGNLDFRMFAKLVSLCRPRRRSASTSTHSKTSPSSLTTLWTPWMRSPDNVLSSWQYQPCHFHNFWFYRARKTEGAEQSSSYTPRIASPCVWSQHTSVNGKSRLLVSGILRSRATQHSEPMLRGLRESSWPIAKVKSCSWARVLLIELVQSLGYVVPGSDCGDEPHATVA